MTTEAKTLTRNAKLGTGAAGGVGLGVVLVWLWNSFMPDQPMPGEVGAALGGFLGPLVNRFLPTER